MTDLSAAPGVQATRLPPAGMALLWTHDGGRLTHGGQATRLRAGDLALVDARIAIGFESADERTGRLLGVEPASIGLPRRQIDPLLGKPIDGTSALAEATKRLWSVGDDLRRAGDDDELTHRHLDRLVGGLVRRLLLQQSERRVSGHAAAMIERAGLLVTRHLADPGFGVGTLAAMMGISARRLSTLFASIGTKPSTAITAARIDHAKALLADPAARTQQIAAIGFACGYPDQGHFARQFRQLVGVSPREYRRVPHVSG